MPPEQGTSMATLEQTSTILGEPPATIAELLHRLGEIPADRVRFQPLPGTATEEDFLRIIDAKVSICELVDGTLVDKPLGYYESEIAGLILTLLNHFIVPRRLGIVTGADGAIRLAPGLVRVPDVAFLARERFPDGKRPKGPIPAIAPDLAVEVLSVSNTKAEIARKLIEYFDAGTRLAWIVDPKRRTVRVHNGPGEADSTLLTDADRIDGGDVLPGFEAAIADFFPQDNDCV